MRDEAEALIEAGALGRSDTYPALLRYLVERSAARQPPKELEIAIDVFGRDAEFDVARDSLVRVYMHKLRQKLDAHYAEHPAPQRLVLPRGRYLISLQAGSGQGAAAHRRGPLALAAAASLALVALTLAYAAGQRGALPQSEPEPDRPLATSALWAPLLEDGGPVTLALGDVFVFAELNSDYEPVREVRQFGINGPADFQRYLEHRTPDEAARLRAPATTWLPPGVAAGLTRLLPLLQADGRDVRVVPASQLGGSPAADGHTVFIGPLETLGPLAEATFAASRYMLHPSAELMVDRETAEIHMREGLPDRPYSERYVDFGLVSRRTAEHGGQFMVLSAVGEAAMVRLIEALTEVDGLERATVRLRALGVDPTHDLEMLYEVASAEDGLDLRLRHAGALPYVSGVRPSPELAEASAQSGSQ